MIKSTILCMHTRNLRKSHKLWFCSVFCDFTPKKSVLVRFELYPQNELFGDKHELVVGFYGKNDQKHDFTDVYSKCAKIPQTVVLKCIWRFYNEKVSFCRFRAFCSKWALWSQTWASSCGLRLKWSEVRFYACILEICKNLINCGFEAYFAISGILAHFVYTCLKLCFWSFLP